MLRHLDEVWQTFELDLGNRIRAEAILVLLEEKFQFCKLNLEDLDVINILVSLAFEFIDFCSELPLVFLAIFNLS